MSIDFSGGVSKLWQWFLGLFTSLLSHFILPVWHDIQTKAGPALGRIIQAGMAVKDQGHAAIMAAITAQATAEGITFAVYEIGFIANALEHPDASTALPVSA